MTINREAIKRNSQKVYGMMQRMCHYSFGELQRFTRLGNIDLSMALVQLLQEGKITQEGDEHGTYYVAFQA